MRKTQKLAMMGLLIALDVIAACFLTVRVTQYLKFGFSFLPVAFTGMLFGPLLGGFGAAAADVLQVFLFPAGGAYIPGITLDAFLSGAVYGLLLHGKKPSLLRSLLAVAICELVISGVLTTVWLYFAMPGKTFPALFLSRIITCLIKTPIETVVIFAFWKLTKKIKAFN